VLAYRRHVDGRIAALLDAGGPAWGSLIELGIQHEQQHQELILTDLKHLFSCNPLRPVYAEVVPAVTAVPALYRWQAQPDGVRQIGYAGDGFSFDNELPRHRVFCEAFEMATRPVTNGEYLEFIRDGGYARHELWLAEGWDVKNAAGWQAPLYWQEEGDGWHVFTLNGMRAPDADAPVCHVSFFEAEAYARWAGARLPTEAEWESYAALQQVAARRDFPRCDPGIRRGVGVDAQRLRTLSWLPQRAGRGRRIQRKIHVQSIRAARRFMCNATFAHPCQLPEFFPRRRSLAIQRHPSGARPRLIF
jgi:ergothioneine biosynthesis protein EgtB